MEYQYDQAVEILRRTPATLAALLSGLDEAWTKSAERPDTWSAYDVVKHLLHADVVSWNWINRIRTILEYGEQLPLDSVEQPAAFEEPEDASLDWLLAAFEQARAGNLATLDAWGMTPEKLALKGTHSELGTVTLGEVLAAWVAHDLNHIGQVVEVLARQYAEAVGPWSAYIAILTRPILTD